MTSPYNCCLSVETSEIRLVVILPGAPSDEIQCHLNCVSLAEFHPREESPYHRRNTPSTAAWFESQGRHDEALQALRSFDTAQCPTQEMEEERRLSLKDLKGPKMSFEALSYTWGGAVGTNNITLNGCQFLVTQNLWDALVHLRFRKIPRTMWIDSLCINQGDVLERSSQVQLMPRIYQSASRTVIWLGETSLREAAVMYCGLNDEVFSFEKEGGQRVEFEAMRKNLYGPHQDFFATIPRLFSLPWWSRIWTIQEVGVAKYVTILAGRFEMSFAALIETTLPQLTLDLDYHRNHNNDIQMKLKITEACNHYRSAVEWQANKDGGGEGRSLLSLVAKHRKKVATDPRDKIYALIGMATDGILLDSDYSLSVDDLYAIFAAKVVTGKLTTAGFPGDPRGFLPLDVILFGRDTPGPSWVPQWNRDWESCAYPLTVHLRDTRDFMSEKGDGWNAHNNTVSNAEICGLRNNTLRARGVEVDTITQIGESCSSAPSLAFKYLISSINTWGDLLIRHFGNDIRPVMSTIAGRFSYYSQNVTLDLDFMDEEGLIFMHKLSRVGGQVPQNERLKTLLPPAKEYVSGTTIPEAWIRTFMIDRSVRFLRLLPEDVLAFLEGRLFDEGNLDKLDTFSQLLLETIHQNISRRRLFITRKGYIGLAPESASVGDHIVVLYGCSVPLTFRRESSTGIDCKEKEMKVRLIGECYVHGIMDGEAVQMVERGILSEEAFIIH